MTRCRRALILPVVLFILLMVGLLGAMFAFRVHADVASFRTTSYRLQTRLAAEAGIERVKLMLRYDRKDFTQWYNNPEELHRVIVWGHSLPPEQWGTNDEYNDGDMIYRFSIVADDPRDDEDLVRFGVTDEASKLNLNHATAEQLLKLVRLAVGDSTEIIPEDIVDAIIDWRDPDSDVHGPAVDTEGEYYRGLDKPYMIKNGPFDTVEELLLVKGMTGLILYGEDQNRNGLIEDSEDDGDRTYPPDNADNVLNRGLYPYLTVHSYETNVDNANRQRVYLFGDADILKEELEEALGDDSVVINFIVEATRNQKPQGAGDPNKPGGNTGSGQPDPNTGTGQPQFPHPNVRPEDRDQSDEKPPPEKGAQDPGDEDNTGSGDPENDVPESGEPGGDSANPQDPAPGDSGDEAENGDSDGGASGPRPIRSPASLMLERGIDDNLQPSPVTFEQLEILMDRFTAIPPDQRRVEGLINVNTAPRPVLECIEGLTEEQVTAILEIRPTLTAQARSTTAWLLTYGAVDVETFDVVAPQITARGQQFMIESLGYADHVGMVTRLQAVVDMVGPIAQTLYYRDISQLGGAYPIREKDLERVVGR